MYKWCLGKCLFRQRFATFLLLLLKNFVLILYPYNSLEIDRCGFLGADADIIVIHGAIADIDK